MGYNQKVKVNNESMCKKFIASLDIKSLYPSLTCTQCELEVKNLIISSNINMKGVNSKELAIFIRKHLTSSEIESNGLKHLIPVKLKKKNLTKNKDTEEDKDDCEDKYEGDTYSSWIFPKQYYNESDDKIMMSEVIAFAVKFVMNNHIYVFDGNVYLQENEGSIGIRLTGLLAEIIMIIWCKKFSSQMEEIGVQNDLLSRFVDDLTVLPTVIPPGFRFENGKLNLHKELIDEDIEVEDDKRTMDIIQKIANSINENLQVTYDIPSNHEDKMVPILDVKAKLNNQNKIDFKFYKKPIANDLVTMKSSALSMKNKFTILTQQCFTRLHNTSESLGEQAKVDSLNYFMHQLQISGYSEKEREIILKGSIETYKNLKLKEFSKVRPFYRNK